MCIILHNFAHSCVILHAQHNNYHPVKRGQESRGGQNLEDENINPGHTQRDALGLYFRANKGADYFHSASQNEGGILVLTLLNVQFS